MTTEDTQFTVGKTTFYQGEHGTHPLFRIEPGIPCRDAREQSSELMGYVRELTITGLMDEKTDDDLGCPLPECDGQGPHG
ncbi:hypothetical protein PPS11_13101 [Pseudomonas putida S11]|nr:hypothetical protein PPS11_13101 [Pseudomonas putida S11]